ncbi:MAG TPA: DegV family protein, partial [Firmicutes bacterium]|nr:DegV family protein [Bacillota bacterium]
MSKIAISVETAADFTPELLQKFDIHTIPFTIVMDGKEGKDGEIKSQDLFDFVSRTGHLPHTSAINVGEFETYFKRLLQDYDEVIHISLSSGISCACQNAFAAEKEFEGKIFVIDSMVLSTGIAL